jgi:RHS repeat-associated core domain
LDPMHGLGMYDYIARGYDGMRFTSMDPLAEKYPWISPYAYCLNNPVRFIDPDGRDVRIWYKDEDKKSQSWTFNGTNQDQAPENEFVQGFVSAYNYNIENGGGDKMQEAATATDYTIHLMQTEGHSYGDLSFPKNSNKTLNAVYWNSGEGLETPQGTLSPATILEHEIDHRVEWQTNTSEYRQNRDVNKNADSHFGNKEEKRVIMGSEYKTGVVNGELRVVPSGQKNNSSFYRGHGRNSRNIFVPVASPTSNKKKP